MYLISGPPGVTPPTHMWRGDGWTVCGREPDEETRTAVDDTRCRECILEMQKPVPRCWHKWIWDDASEYWYCRECTAVNLERRAIASVGHPDEESCPKPPVCEGCVGLVGALIQGPLSFGPLDKYLQRRADLSNRAALMRGVRGLIGAAIIGDLLHEQDAFCATRDCGTLKPGLWDIDHILPISKGGQHNAGNLQILCRPCNLTKGGDVEILEEADNADAEDSH